MSATRPRIVIIGGGFGGLNAARGLKHAPVEVMLIDRRNFHLFQPLLYQVATGGLSPGDISSPLRGILRRQRNAYVLMGEVKGLDTEGRQVILERETIPYDTLIIATGARHSYFGHDDWEKVSPGLKTLEDATTMRSRLLSAFEAAENEPDAAKRREWLTFVIVGGGPTGVELAGALGEIASCMLKDDFRRIRPEEARILLLDAGDRLLAAYPEELSAKAERSLLGLGVRTRTGAQVTEIDENGLTARTAHGEERITSRTVLWAAGVRGTSLLRTLSERTGAALDRAGRVKVQPDLSVPGHPEILVIGDAAALEQNGHPVPGVAPAAMQMGTYAAGAIRQRLRGETPKPFRYFNKGDLAVIGRAAAVAHFGPIKFGGILAWLAWLFIHLMYLVGFQNRMLVFVHWGFLYLTRNSGARLITRDYRGSCES